MKLTTGLRPGHSYDPQTPDVCSCLWELPQSSRVPIQPCLSPFFPLQGCMLASPGSPEMNLASDASRTLSPRESASVPPLAKPGRLTNVSLLLAFFLFPFLH